MEKDTAACEQYSVAIGGEDDAERLADNLDVFPDAAILYVPDVHLHPVVELNLVAIPGGLPVAGESRTHKVALKTEAIHLLHLFGTASRDTQFRRKPEK